MSTIIFTASRDPVTVRGPSLEADLRYLLDALRCVGPTAESLILDLTHVDALSRHATVLLLQTCSEVTARGIELRVTTRPGSPAERMVTDVRANGDRCRLHAVSNGAPRT